MYHITVVSFSRHQGFGGWHTPTHGRARPEQWNGFLKSEGNGTLVLYLKQLSISTLHPSFLDLKKPLVNDRPSVVITKKVNAKLSSTSSVVVVVHKHIRITVRENSRVSRTVNVAVASEKLLAATLHHRLARLVNIRTSDRSRAADHGAVSAVDALAASVESGPEVEVVAVLGDDGSLDGAAVVRARGDGDEVVRIDGLAGRRVQLDELETAPEGAEGEPPFAVGSDVEVGVDGVPAAVGEGLDHEAEVGPGAGSTGLAGCEEDSRARGAEAGGGVVHVVLAVVVGEVGSPEVLVAFGVGGCPGGAVGEGGADVLPGGAVGGGLQTDAVGCEGGEVSAIWFLDNGWVVDEGITLDGTRVDSTLLETEGRRCQSANSKETTSEEGTNRHHDEVFVSECL
jgi:hypothetical protein